MESITNDVQSITKGDTHLLHAATWSRRVHHGFIANIAHAPFNLFLGQSNIPLTIKATCPPAISWLINHWVYGNEVGSTPGECPMTFYFWKWFIWSREWVFRRANQPNIWQPLGKLRRTNGLKNRRNGTKMKMEVLKLTFTTIAQKPHKAFRKLLFFS